MHPTARNQTARRPLAQRLTRALAVLTGLYLGLCAALYALQDRLTFLPSRNLRATPAAVGLQYEELWLAPDPLPSRPPSSPPSRPRGRTGNSLHAWFVPHPAARATVLFLHGNGGNISHRLETLRLLHELRLATLILDYPGYGLSWGEPSEAGCYRAARAGLAHLREAGCDPIVVWGRSLGGGVASELLGDPGVDRLVLESSFTSLPEIAQHAYPWLPARLLARNHFDSRARLAHSTVPVLIVHSRDDEIVPFEHGLALFAAAREPKQFAEIQGDHNSGFSTSGKLYTDAIEAFLGP